MILDIVGVICIALIVYGLYRFLKGQVSEIQEITPDLEVERMQLEQILEIESGKNNIHNETTYTNSVDQLKRSN